MEIGFLRAPEEACGIIVPDFDKKADDWVHELKNRHEQPTQHYRIDPQTIIDLITNPDIWDDVVIWHTHLPGGTIGPSRGDVRDAVVGVKYVVVCLPGGELMRYGTGW